MPLVTHSGISPLSSMAPASDVAAPGGRRRGRYKIFLGMAAGVGKTYSMLREGQADANAGRDVVVGYLEPHDRQETVDQAAGLEMLPRRRVAYRDSTLEEMDLPALLRRMPELALIDELAHTNAPGVEHQKRYQDIEYVLAAGIDVYSTVNVQHLESLNDQVAELTGIRVRETVPDAVLGSADDVVLIDITPQSLIERLLAGKVYPGERVEAALNNFFKLENLSALREVALRQVAEEVEAKRIPAESGTSGRGREERLIDTAAPQAIGERLLALITPSPSLSAWCGGPGARPSASAASSTCCGSPTATPTPLSRSSSTRCAGWPACSAPICSSSTATTSRSPPSAWRSSAAAPTS